MSWPASWAALRLAWAFSMADAFSLSGDILPRAAS
jgi:hypothetical protein